MGQKYEFKEMNDKKVFNFNLICILKKSNIRLVIKTKEMIKQKNTEV